MKRGTTAAGGAPLTWIREVPYRIAADFEQRAYRLVER